jgi:hypothetical protein
LCVDEPVMGRMVHTKLESVSWLRSDGIFCVWCVCDDRQHHHHHQHQGARRVR